MLIPFSILLNFLQKSLPLSGRLLFLKLIDVFDKSGYVFVLIVTSLFCLILPFSEACNELKVCYFKSYCWFLIPTGVSIFFYLLQLEKGRTMIMLMRSGRVKTD